MSKSKKAAQLASLLDIPYQKAHQLLTGISILNDLSDEQRETVQAHLDLQKFGDVFRTRRGFEEKAVRRDAWVEDQLNIDNKNHISLRSLREPFLDRKDRPAEFPYEGYSWTPEQTEAFFGVIWSYLDREAWVEFRKHLQENYPEEVASADQVLKKLGASIVLEDGTMKGINWFNNLVRNFEDKDRAYINNHLMNIKFIFGIGM